MTAPRSWRPARFCTASTRPTTPRLPLTSDRFTQDVVVGLSPVLRATPRSTSTSRCRFARVLIDHVIYAAASLGAATARIEDELGVAAVGGGRHEGHGTENRIVPLGGGYLEVLGVADPQEAATSPFGRGLLARLERSGDGWLTWVVAVPDVDAVANRLSTTITTLAREGLTARLTGVAESMREPFLPFFVSRDRGVADPGAGSDAGGISWIEVAGDAVRLERWLDFTPLAVRVVEGPAAICAVGIGDRPFSPGS
jgi:hypothetical protein